MNTMTAAVAAAAATAIISLLLPLAPLALPQDYLYLSSSHRLRLLLPYLFILCFLLLNALLLREKSF